MPEDPESPVGEDWELVSSSEDGEPGLAEEAALSATFLLAEPSAAPAQPSTPGADAVSPLSYSEGYAQPATVPLAGFPAPGSPERLQLLRLEAAVGTPAGGAGAHSSKPSPTAVAPGAVTTPTADGEACLAARQPGSPAVTAAGATAASRTNDAGGSVTLRAVRSDEQESLHWALSGLEKRASQHERDLALARARLANAQGGVAQEARDAHRLRRLAMVACSVCAFLGLKALLGSPRLRCGPGPPPRGAAVLGLAPGACGAAAAAAAGGLRLDAALGELDGSVAVLVEPLGRSA